MSSSYNLFFVCTANICRSPIAQGLAPIIAQQYGLRIHARSGGTLGIMDKPPAANSIKTLKKKNIDISHLRSSGITENDMDWCDYALVMTPKHAKTLRQRFPDKHDKILILANFGGSTEVSDPVGRWIFAFNSCRKHIEKCLHAFFKELAARPS